MNGTNLIDNPSTPPVHTYSASIHLTAGTTYTISISGDTSQLLWATPTDLAPYLSAAVTAAKSASTAVVVVSDDTESEATDRPSLSLPSAQDELIADVAAANPNTVVVINAGAPVTMPWLGSVAAVLDTRYPGQTSGTALASVLFGQTDPGGHLPVTFPTSLSQVPASTTAEFPGDGNEVLYSEGVDVGYRWYAANAETPLFPFGYGLSYTSFAFSGLKLSSPAVTGTADVTVSATITDTGSRAGSDVAQLYVGDPAATGEPPRQLEGFKRVRLAPGQAARVLVHPHAAAAVLVERHRERLDGEQGHVLDLRRRLLGAAEPAAARGAPGYRHAWRAAGRGERAVERKARQAVYGPCTADGGRDPDAAGRPAGAPAAAGLDRGAGGTDVLPRRRPRQGRHGDVPRDTGLVLA